jgi:hypothetical protein
MICVPAASMVDRAEIRASEIKGFGDGGLSYRALMGMKRAYVSGKLESRISSGRADASSNESGEERWNFPAFLKGREFLLTTADPWLHLVACRRLMSVIPPGCFMTGILSY